MIDTHCHVHFRAYQDDMDEVIRRNLARGIRIITVGTQTTTSRDGVAVAERYDGVWATVGLHPNHTCEQEFVDEQELASQQKIKTRCETFDKDAYRQLAKHPKVVAIGECGLDFFRIPTHLDRGKVIETQKREFRSQLQLADELNLPVVIHCRDAHKETQSILKEFISQKKLTRRGVVHCFTGTVEEATAYHHLQFLTSFTGIITFPPKKQEGDLSAVQQTVKALSLKMILLETDAPYLAPEPHRGERNEPWMVEFVAKKIAELKGVSLEEVIAITTQNAERLFHLS
jgi:TatD DNase family protein